jgi:hypothetical protein
VNCLRLRLTERVGGVKVRAEHGCGSEKPTMGVEKWLEMPRDERIITKTLGKAQLEL